MYRRGLPPLFADLAGLDNVVGVGTGKKIVRGEATPQDAVLIFVRRKCARSDLKRDAEIPRRVAGMPTDVIEIGDIKLLNNRTEKMRPARPGISIGHYKVSAGTFGAVVKDRSTGDLLILSNNHVLANGSDGADGRANLGDRILQPGIIDGDCDNECMIAQLHRFVPLVRQVSTPQCSIAKAFEGIVNKCVSLVRPHYRIQVLRENEKINLVDCALAKPVDPHMINPDILDLGSVLGVVNPNPGMAIKKSGRSTGVSHSIVLATDVTIKVEIGRNEYAIFTEQALAGPMSMPGDSGSLILTEDNYAVGLLFAGSSQATLFNRIDYVLDSLNIEF